MIKSFRTRVEVSARHIHLSSRDLARLFGKNYQLKVLRKISQPGQFAAQETVKLVGPKGAFPRVRVVGPVRSATQVEISVTDSLRLGINPLMRMSGDLKGTTGGLRVIGPRGSIKLNRGVIIAQRHLHLEPLLAKKYGLKHRSTVCVEIPGKRSLIFRQVVVRSRLGIDKLSFQIDTDEGNTAGIVGQGTGRVILNKAKK